MKQYLDLIRYILENGSLTPQRAKVDGKSICMLVCPGLHFEHDMKNGFPLLTTKQVPLMKIAAELEVFIKGLTTKDEFHNRNCRFWDSWQKPSQNDPNQLGRIYGAQWRGWRGWREVTVDTDTGGGDLHLGWEQYEIDQLRNLVNTLKTDPYDRRTVVSAWNPAELDQMALPACHLMFQTVTTIINGHHTLNLHMVMRSADMMLGVPFNIASYAILLLLLCEETGMEPGKLSVTFVNAHIYENHIDAASIQINRKPFPLPTVEILSDTRYGLEFDLFNWSYLDINIKDYQCHPPIKMKVAV